VSAFQLHRNGPCVLCKGAEQDSAFDYCRACGFTVLPLRENESAPPPSPLQKLAMTCRELAHPSPPTTPVNLSAITNDGPETGQSDVLQAAMTTDAQLEAMCAQHVAGWTLFPDLTTDGMVYWEPPKLAEGGRGLPMRIPRYCSDPAAVIELLDTWQRVAKSKHRLGYFYWQGGTYDEQNSRDYWVELCGMVGGTVMAQAPTFAKAGVLALLRARGVEVEG